MSQKKVRVHKKETSLNVWKMIQSKLKSDQLLEGFLHLCDFPQVKSGIVMNLLTVGALVVMFNTLGVLIYDLDEFPSWAEPNATMSSGVNRVARNISVALLRHWTHRSRREIATQKWEHRPARLLATHHHTHPLIRDTREWVFLQEYFILHLWRDCALSRVVPFCNLYTFLLV